MAAVLLLAANSTAAADGPLTMATTTVAHDLAPPNATLVVASPLTSDVAAPRADELSQRVANLVASAIGPSGRVAPHPMTLAAARALSSRSAALLFVDVRVEGGELRLTSDLYPVVGNGWDRIRAPAPPPSKHSFVHVRVAAEVRAYLTPIHLERARVTRFAQDIGTVLAVLCGDVEGGTGNALVVVTQGEIAWGHLAGGRFVATRRAAASSIGRRAPTPMREPLASLALTEGDTPTLYVGWTGRSGAGLGSDLGVRSRISGLPVPSASRVLCLVPNSAKAGFDALVDCADGQPTEGVAPVPLFDAWSEADISRPDGEHVRVVAARDPLATLHLVRGSESLTVDGVGAEVALGDLDQDGVVEVVTTTTRGDDALVVSSWRASGLVERLRIAAPRGVDAVAVCPADANDAPAVVAAVGPEIWLVH